MPQAVAIAEALRKLREVPFALDSLDDQFRRSFQRYGCKSPKQRAVLARMVEVHLQDAALAAEILGQERLFA